MVSPLTLPFTRTHTAFLFGLPFDDLSTGEAVGLVSRQFAQEEEFQVLVLDLPAILEGIGARGQQEFFVGASLVLCESSFLHSLLPPAPHGLGSSGGFSAVDFFHQLVVEVVEKGQTIGLCGREFAILAEVRARLARKYANLIPPLTAGDAVPCDSEGEGVEQSPPDVVFDFSPSLPLRRAGREREWDGMPRVHFTGVSVLRSVLPGVRLMHPGDRFLHQLVRLPHWIYGGVRLVFQGARQRGVLSEKSPVFRYPISGDFPATIQHLVWTGNLGGGSGTLPEMPDNARPFAIDLSGVTFIDSAGLGTLLRIMRKSWAAGRAGCFINPSPPVRRVLTVSRLEAMLPVVETYGAAVEFLAAQSLTLPLKPSFEEKSASLRLVMPEALSADNSGAVAEAVEIQWDLHEAASHLLLDFKATQFLDSSGLGCLLRIHRMVGRRMGSSMELRHVSNSVGKILKIAKLDSLFWGKESGESAAGKS